jgi:hypothetical protein
VDLNKQCLGVQQAFFFVFLGTKVQKCWLSWFKSTNADDSFCAAPPRVAGDKAAEGSY